MRCAAACVRRTSGVDSGDVRATLDSHRATAQVRDGQNLMNPLPRFFALGLLVILVALTAVLAAPVLRKPKPEPGPPIETAAPASRMPAPRLMELTHRVALPLALTGFVVAVALVASLTLRAAATEPAAPRSVSRAEMGALARLAETSVTQGRELEHERDVRQRAEADALLNQQRLNRSLEEKIRLGRDLHDGIIQSLYAAGLTIESARALTRTDPPEADRRLAECRDNLNQTIRDVRAYIAGLAPDSLRQSGFHEALNSLVQELGADRNVEFELRIDDAATALLTPDQTTEALQIAREAVSNSLRHGAATRVVIRLHPGDGEACLLVQDNGRGFAASGRTGAGHGLGNISARAERLGGAVRIESTPGAGTRVVLTIPTAAS